MPCRKSNWLILAIFILFSIFYLTSLNRRCCYVFMDDSDLTLLSVYYWMLLINGVNFACLLSVFLVKFIIFPYSLYLMNYFKQWPIKVYAYFCYTIGGGGSGMAGSVCDAKDEMYPSGIYLLFIFFCYFIFIIQFIEQISYFLLEFWL